MRWLLLKDLQILRRSPLLVATLVIYPIVVAVLIGAALSGGPAKPRVALVNLLPTDQRDLAVGGEQLDARGITDALFRSVDPVRARTRAEAVAMVRSGKALGALIIPADLVERLQGTLALGGGPAPSVEVIYNGRDPVRRRYVESTIEARIAEAGRAVSSEVTRVAARYLGIVVRGGQLSILGQKISILGLRRARTIIDASIASLPADAPERIALAQVARFAGLAADNLDVSGPILASLGDPVHVRQTVLDGRRTPLDAFAVAVAAAVSLMLVCVLLAAGLLALEREEHVVARLVRGLVRPSVLLGEKIVLAAGCAAAVTLLMLIGLALFVDLDWGRVPLWIAALAAAGLAFGALGTALGALARDVRAASLLGLLLALPLAFLALVPDGSVSGGLQHVIDGVSAVFPFAPSLDALDAALNGGGIVVPLAHLLGLAVGFGAIGRIALRGFA
jgi:ABC-2 type transport system permease protein